MLPLQTWSSEVFGLPHPHPQGLGHPTCPCSPGGWAAVGSPPPPSPGWGALGRTTAVRSGGRRPGAVVREATPHLRELFSQGLGWAALCFPEVCSIKLVRNRNPASCDCSRSDLWAPEVREVGVFGGHLCLVICRSKAPGSTNRANLPFTEMPLVSPPPQLHGAFIESLFCRPAARDHRGPRGRRGHCLSLVGPWGWRWRGCSGLFAGLMLGHSLSRRTDLFDFHALGSTESFLLELNQGQKGIRGLQGPLGMSLMLKSGQNTSSVPRCPAIGLGRGSAPWAHGLLPEQLPLSPPLWSPAWPRGWATEAHCQAPCRK